MTNPRPVPSSSVLALAHEPLPLLLDSARYRQLLRETHPQLQFNDNRVPDVPTFLAPLDTKEPLVPGFFRSVVKMGEAVMPKTVVPHALFLGTPFERYDQTHLLDDLPPAATLAKVCHETAAQENASVVVITNVSVEHPRAQEFAQSGFVALPSFPDTLIDLPDSFDALLARRPQGDRSGIRRNIRRFDRAGHRVRRVRDSAPIMDALYASYRPIFDRAKVKWQAHTSAYFGALTSLGDDVVLSVAENGRGEVIGFVVNFKDGSSMQAGRIGVAPAYHRKDAVYFRLLYEAVFEAIDARCQTLSLEPTGYRMKRHLGARRVPLCNLILGVSPLWRTLLRTCAGLGRSALSHLLDESQLEQAY